MCCLRKTDGLLVGTVMALGLYLESSKTLRVAATYEDGRFALFSLDKGKAGWEEPHLEENAGWQTIFIAREHTQPSESFLRTCTIQRGT